MEQTYSMDPATGKHRVDEPAKMDSLQLTLGPCDLGLQEEETISNIMTAHDSSHCLICNDPCSTTVDDMQFNIFAKLKTRDESSKSSIFEKMGQILDIPLGSIDLHSESICCRCLNLVAHYDETETLLWAIRSELHVKFEFTARQHANGSAGQQLPVLRKEANRRPIDTESVRNKKREVELGDEETRNDSDADEFPEPEMATTSGRPLLKFKKLNNRGVNASNKRTPYLCTVCGKSFRAFSHRVEHMLIHLGEKPWGCEECKKAFRTKSALRIHTMKHTGVRPYTCLDCNKSFSDRYYYDEHCRVHTGERPFDCSYCGRLFARKKDLAIHKKSHTGDKPFKCTFCSKAFAVKSRLDRHSRTHSGDRPHSCEYCEKSFSRRDDYKVHLRQHTGERPFQCSVCKKAFSNKSNYLVHIRRHTGSNAFGCLLCEDGFSQRGQLEKHMSDKHPKSIQSAAPDHGTSQDHSASRPMGVHELAQPMLSAANLQGYGAPDLRSMQGMPVGQVAQLAWGDGTPANAYVNVASGAYVNILPDS